MKTEIKHQRKFQFLPDHLKHILFVAALHAGPMRQRSLLECLDAMGMVDQFGRNYLLRTLQMDVKQLETKGCLVKGPLGVSCAEPFLRPAIFDAVQKGVMAPMILHMARICPFETRRKNIVFRDAKEYQRAVNMAVFSHEAWADVSEIHRLGRLTPSMVLLSESPFLSMFNTPFDRDFIDTLPLKTRIHVLEALIDDALCFLRPAGDAVASLMALVPKHYAIMDAGLCFRAVLLSGQCHSLVSMADVPGLLSDPGWCFALACARFLAGDTARALDDGLSVFKGRKGGVLFHDERDIVFLFAMLAEPRPEKDVVFQSIRSLLEKMTHPCHFQMIVLMSLIEDDPEDVELLDYTPDAMMVGNAFEQWCIVLISYWMNNKRTKQYETYLFSLEKKAALGGYRWFEAEVSALLALLGDPKRANESRADDMHQAMGTVSLTRLYTPLSPWESQLKTLEKLVKNTDDDAGSNENAQTRFGERLVWLLSYNERFGTCSVAPRLQILSKKGDWTRGRPVALKTLYRGHNAMDYLTEQDHRICKAIREYSYNTGRYRYPGLEYKMDEETALPELVGHPLLFLNDDHMVPVELVEGPPELRVSEKGSSVTITLNPMPMDMESRTRLIRETPSLFKLIRFSNIHLRIAEQVGGKGLTIPAKARERVSQLAGSLSSHITVRADMDIAFDENLRDIPADSTPHVHVMPYQGGVSVSVFVRPVPDLDSYVKPGRGGRQVLADIKGEKIKALRNHEAELERVRQWVDRCPTLTRADQEDDKWFLSDTEDALELLYELKECGDTIILKWPQGETMKLHREVSYDDFSLVLTKERDWFSASGELRVNEDLSVDLARLMTLLDKPTGRFVVLEDGTFLAITRTFKKHLEELKAYGQAYKNSLRLPPLSALALEDFTLQIGDFKADDSFRDHLKTLKTVVTPNVPGTLKACLRDYQVAGFEWLATLQHWGVGACLADDMGLGKTVQALAAILLSAAKGPTLVVAPLSVLGNWMDECTRFAPTLVPRQFGQGDRGAFLDSLGPFDLVISSYGLLQSENEKLAAVSWQTVVLDEAQAIKNMNTKRSKAAMTLSARFRLVTTGTPVENHLSELWTLFRFLNPGLLGTWTHFREAYVLPVERDQDKEASHRLKKLIRPFILRRIKSDVLSDLPDKTEVDLDVVMSDEEAMLYEAQRQVSIAAIERAGEEGAGQKRIRVLAELTRLRQLCCHPSLILPDMPLTGSKLKVFGDLVRELLDSHHKALVFSQFVRHLTVLRTYLDGQGISYRYLDGSTPAAERRRQVDAFQNGEGDLFLISLKAGGFGLNLTAADYVIHMDPWWNPAVEDQASDRAHRIGQTRPVTVYRLIMKNTIEEKIIRLHKDKRDLAESILSGTDVSAAVSTDELLDLLKGKG